MSTHRDNPSPGSPTPHRRAGIGPHARPDAQRASSLMDTHVRTLIHELSGLLDGSLRYLHLAQGDLAAIPLGEIHSDDARRHLEAADHALTHMADIVRSVSDPFDALIDVAGDERSGTFERPRPLVDAIRHAVEVVRPLADERSITIDVEIGERLNHAPPAPIYPIVANALRNSIEALALCGTRGAGGRIEVHADAEGPVAGMYDIRIDVLDDGEGPDAAAIGRAFLPGYSTKRGGSGLGLALARDIVKDLKGTIELAVRWPERPARRGARLSVRYRGQRGGPVIIGGSQ